MILSKNRKNILQGTVTISGNEYMQPGEVVFLEDRQMLFYVSSVSHTFTQGRSFDTTLNLTYGHTPGEYIPNVTDIIGKLIYNNRDVAELVIDRQSSSSNELSIGVIQRSNDDSGIDNSANLNNLSKTLDVFNAQTIENILYTTRYLLNANESENQQAIASIELRIYHDNNNKPDPDLEGYANGIRDILLGRNDATDLASKDLIVPLNIKQVKPIEDSFVNLDDTDDRRSPSQKAIDAARNHKETISTNGGGASNPGTEDDGGQATETESPNINKDSIRVSLFKYIIDCWVTIQPIFPQTSNGS
jgi:hypothetical protein